MAIYSKLEEAGIIKTLVLVVGLGITIPVIGVSFFWMIPVSGLACFSGLLLICASLLLECAIGVNLNLFIGVIPFFGGAFIALLVYSAAGVPLVRGTLFYWPASKPLKVFHVIVTCFASSFSILSSCMYFIRPQHENLMSLILSKLNGPRFPDLCLLGFAIWMFLWILSMATRTSRFDRLVAYITQRVCKIIPKEEVQVLTISASVQATDESESPSPCELGKTST